MRKRDAEPLLREARERLTEGWEHDRENRADGFKDLQMIAGDQWPALARQQREADGRPCITVNGLTQFVHQCANDIRNNPPGIRVVPADGSGNKDIATTYSGLIREIEYQSHASAIYAMAAGHAIGCGIGHMRVNTEYAADDAFEQNIVIQRIPFPLSVIWDPEAILPDRSDAKWCFVTEMVHEKTWEKRFPGTKPSNVDLPTGEADPEAGLFWKNGQMYRIGEYWYRVPVRKKLVMLEDGGVMDVTELKRHDFFNLPPVIAERDVESYRIEQSLVSGSDLLAEPTKWAGRFIPIVPVVGGEVPLESKIVRYGLIRFARDPQQLYNYARSAAAESIGLAPKAPYLVTPTMIAKYKAQWDSHNVTQRPYLLYDPDDKAPGAAPKREAPPMYPEAFIQEANISSGDMQRATGIYEAALGQRSNETSGIAIISRERQGDTATSHYSGNLHISMMHMGKILIDLIPKIYDTERSVRILGEDEQEEFVPINHVVMSDNGVPVLMNDMTQGRYSTRLRIGPAYATKRIEAAESMLAFVQAVPAAAGLIGDLIASNMDWPGADQIAERLKRAIPPQILGDEGQEDKTPEAMEAEKVASMLQQALAQLQMRDQQAEVAKKEADASKSQASAIDLTVDTLLKLLTARLQGMPIPDGMPQAPSPGGGGGMPPMGGTGQPPAGPDMQTMGGPGGAPGGGMMPPGSEPPEGMGPAPRNALTGFGGPM